MSDAIEVKVPDIGDFKDVEVIELLVKPGDQVLPEQSLVTVESDKASMEIPSSVGGVVRELRVHLGDKVNQGSVLMLIEPSEGASSAAQAGPSEGASSAAQVAPSGAAEPDGAASARPAAMPAGETASELRTPPPEGAPGPAQGGQRAQAVTGGAGAPAPGPAAPAAGAGTGAATGAATGAGAGAAGAAPGTADVVVAPPQPVEARSHPVPTAMRGGESHVVKPHASPSVRQFARELGVDLERVRGTGPKQRITHDDVRAFVKDAVGRAGAASPAAQAPSAGGAALGLLPWPTVDFARFGPVESRPLPRIKRIAGANLHRNWVMIPHVTNCDDADVTELEALRRQLNDEQGKGGVKVTLLAFIIKACASALQRFPEFNASLDGEQLVLKRYWHVGFAVDTPNGLVVPVIRDVDRKGVLQVAAEMAELSAKARDGKLSPSDMQGGTFSISSIGGIGGTYFTPIINAPEVAILGVCRSTMRPVWQHDTFVPRLILPLSLSYDHRVIDGAAAARFNAYLAQLLADFRRAVL